MFLSARSLIFLAFLCLGHSCATTSKPKVAFTSQPEYLQKSQNLLGLDEVFSTPISSNTIKVFPHLQAFSGQLLIGNPKSHIVVDGYHTNDGSAQQTLPVIHAVFLFQNQKWNSLTQGSINLSSDLSKTNAAAPQTSMSEGKLFYTMPITTRDTFIVEVDPDQFSFGIRSERKLSSGSFENESLLQADQSISAWINSPTISVADNTVFRLWQLPYELEARVAEDSSTFEVAQKSAPESQSTGILLKDEDGIYSYRLNTTSQVLVDQLAGFIDANNSANILVVRDILKESNDEVSISLACPLSSSTLQEYANAVQKIGPDSLDLRQCPEKATDPVLLSFLDNLESKSDKAIALVTEDLPSNEQLAH